MLRHFLVLGIINLSISSVNSDKFINKINFIFILFFDNYLNFSLSPPLLLILLASPSQLYLPFYLGHYFLEFTLFWNYNDGEAFILEFLIAVFSCKS